MILNFKPLWNEWHRGSDRSFALVASSMIDELLLQLLRAHFIPQYNNGSDRILGNNSPLGTFSARIDICQRLGLLSSQFCRNLNLVRKIRNEFAHSFEEITFETPQICDRVTELTKSSGILDRNPAIGGDFRSTKAGEFLIFTSCAAALLSAYVEDDVEPFSQEGVEWIYTTTAFVMNDKA